MAMSNRICFGLPFWRTWRLLNVEGRFCRRGNVIAIVITPYPMLVPFGPRAEGRLLCGNGQAARPDILDHDGAFVGDAGEFALEEEGRDILVDLEIRSGDVVRALQMVDKRR
jgi:hypothetical protein